jgi:hypothetical protein
MTDRDVHKPLLLRALQHDDSRRGPGGGNSPRQTALLQTLGLPPEIDAGALARLLVSVHLKPEDERLRLIEASGLARQSSSSRLTERNLVAVLLRISAPHVLKAVLLDINVGNGT